jgi:hypothetical protein
MCPVSDDEALWQKVDDALNSDDTVLEACRNYIETLSPAIDAICNGINVSRVGRNLIYRCIAKRMQENVGAIIAFAESDYSSMSPMPLRPLCEDLIYGCWLRGLPAEDVDSFVEMSIWTDILKGMGVQSRFLPRAYKTYTLLPNEAQSASDPVGAKPDEPERDAIFETAHLSYRQQLKILGKKLGWNNGRTPSIYEMAKSCDLIEIYEFFYHGASKSVHSDMHTMGRMVWGTPGGSFNISSQNFANYYRLFALAYSVWLAEELFERLIAPEFSKECLLIDGQAHSVWLAMVLTGLARNKAFPPLVTKEELRWRS